MTQVNDHLVLISGKSATGKSMCLRNLSNVLYLNCEAGKKLPFKPNNFKEVSKRVSNLQNKISKILRGDAK